MAEIGITLKILDQSEELYIKFNDELTLKEFLELYIYELVNCKDFAQFHKKQLWLVMPEPRREIIIDEEYFRTHTLPDPLIEYQKNTRGEVKLDEENYDWKFVRPLGLLGM